MNKLAKLFWLGGKNVSFAGYINSNYLDLTLRERLSELKSYGQQPPFAALNPTIRAFVYKIANDWSKWLIDVVPWKFN